MSTEGRGRCSWRSSGSSPPRRSTRSSGRFWRRIRRSTWTGPTPAPAAGPGRALLVVPSTLDRLDELLAIAEPLAQLPGRELIIARLLQDEGELRPAASALNARRTGLGASARTAAFTTLEPARDVVRLATIYDVELVLLDAPPALDANGLPAELASILERSPADVAVLTGPSLEPGRGAGVFVPFGGGEHDWAALELGAWLASATSAPLRLVGTGADLRRGQRDASRLLADASLAVQRVVGVETEPLLAEPTKEALVKAVDAATLIVVGISPRWRQDGIGAAAEGARPRRLALRSCSSTEARGQVGSLRAEPHPLHLVDRARTQLAVRCSGVSIPRRRSSRTPPSHRARAPSVLPRRRAQPTAPP